MLIASHRHREGDLSVWRELEKADLANAGQRLAEKEVRSLHSMAEFISAGPCYVGVSWGKDSTVLAHLISRLPRKAPLVWIKQLPSCNPDCDSVRDAFLSCHALEYAEIVVWMRQGQNDWHGTGTLETGFAEAVRRFGNRYLSGIRAEESGGRKIRMRRFGLTSKNACAPLGWWTQADVFAYLAKHKLPVHPCYAMLGEGRWPRERIRTCRLDGKGGGASGRAEWESEYYGDVLNRIHS